MKVPDYRTSHSKEVKGWAPGSEVATLPSMPKVLGARDRIQEGGVIYFFTLPNSTILNTCHPRVFVLSKVESHGHDSGSCYLCSFSLPLFLLSFMYFPSFHKYKTQNSVIR